MANRLSLAIVWSSIFILFTVGGSFAQKEKTGSEVFELGEVVVTGKQETVSLATTVTEVAEEDIKAMGAQTVADALDQIPGVDVRTGGKGQSYVRIRGFDQEDGGKRDLSDYIRRTLNAKIGYEPDKDTKAYLSFDYHDNERGCPTEFDRYWAFSKWDQWHLNLVGEKNFNELLTIKARAFYVDHDDTIVDVSWDDDHQTKKKWFEESAYDDYSVGGELHTYLDFGKLSLLKIGFIDL